MLGQCGDADEPHAGSQQEIVRSSQGVAICELLRQVVEGPLPFMPEGKMYGFQGKARSGDLLAGLGWDVDAEISARRGGFVFITTRSPLWRISRFRPGPVHSRF